MGRRSDIVKLVIGLFALISGAVAAKADTKAGTDAWSRGDYVVAVEEWRQPALEGDAEAQFHLGQAYRLGRGVKTDLNTALDWYRKAAAQGHIQAGDNCGHLLHYQKKGNYIRN
ncbi:MAG: sel1 repeat family protein [Sphingorhabdus sp.]|uniref:tetratricopeptide repeat protein n=1 Tax=Sphingorhabdus sp. TaxID=1902408 RepID=UPI003457A960|nr:sel1 repeat family protein [Sphingorhabdus sp.]